MEWTLAILFIGAVVLFILSFLKTESQARDVQKQVDQHFVHLTDEMNKLADQVRNLELDVEILEHETGVKVDRAFVREVIDMYRRGYQIESIAGKMELTAEQVEAMLIPYVNTDGERGTVVNGR